MIKKLIKKFFFPFHLIICALFISLPTFAQVSDDNREQFEAKQEQRQEDLERLQEIQTQPKTADQVLEMLTERAKDRLEKKRRAEFLKTRISAGVTSGFETNPSNTQDILEKGDTWVDNNVTASWIPKFNHALSGDLGYTLAFRSYFEQHSLDTENHSLNGSLKYFPLASGKLTLEPGARQEWNIYPRDSSSSYEQSKGFLKFSYTLSPQWSYGGKYEYAYKVYDKKAAFNDSGANSAVHRTDYRNTGEWWIKRQIGKYSVKLKEKSYRNNSNGEYQHYDDYDAHDGEISISAAFLKNYKLYLVFSSDYEVKNYKRRAGDDATARWDRALQYRFNAYYTLTKNWSASYSVSVKNNSSNKATGEFNDVTNSLGLTLTF